MSDLLVAEQQLRSLADRYADGINRADFDDVGRCWAPNGIWRAPAPFDIEQIGRGPIVAHLVERRRTVDIVVMTVCGVVATAASADRIVGRTTIEEQGRRDDDRGIHVLALYDDVLTRVDDQWLFATRTLNLLAVDNTRTVYTRTPPSLG